MSQTNQLRIAQIFGVASAAWLSGTDRIRTSMLRIKSNGSADRITGYIASMSITGIAAIRKSAPPNVAPKQWRDIFDIGTPRL
jgi:hypothetical protein